MEEPKQSARQRPKIKSSFGAVLKTQHEEDQKQEDTKIPVSQSSDMPQATAQKETKEKRTKKGVYLKPATAKWLDIQAATEGKEISEIAEEALTLLQKIRAGKARMIEV